MNIQEKYEKLQENLRSLGSVAVAYSGGVDSTFLLKTAHDVLGDRAIAVTACSAAIPRRELEESERFCGENKITQIICRTGDDVAEIFRQNAPNRCYLCKRVIFGKLLEIAREQGMAAVAEGSNMDDNGDYRPGMAAVKELSVISPLQDAGLYKEEIRRLSRELGLPTWDKPSCACLASRFVYGESIDEKKLGMVDEAERLLQDLGFRQVRVRVHGEMARIEVLPEEIIRIAEPEMRKRISARLRELGFIYAALDLAGYRTGSMNEAL